MYASLPRVSVPPRQALAAPAVCPLRNVYRPSATANGGHREDAIDADRIRIRNLNSDPILDSLNPLSLSLEYSSPLAITSRIQRLPIVSFRALDGSIAPGRTVRTQKKAKD